MAWNNSCLKNECSNALLALVQFWSQASWMAWNNSCLKERVQQRTFGVGAVLVSQQRLLVMAWNNSCLKNECSNGLHFWHFWSWCSSGLRPLGWPGTTRASRTSATATHGLEQLLELVQFWSQASWMAWKNSCLKNECSNALLELVQFWSQASWMAWNNSCLKNECSNALLELVQFWSQASWMAWNNSCLTFGRTSAATHFWPLWLVQFFWRLV